MYRHFRFFVAPEQFGKVRCMQQTFPEPPDRQCRIEDRSLWNFIQRILLISAEKECASYRSGAPEVAMCSVCARNPVHPSILRRYPTFDYAVDIFGLEFLAREG